MPTSFKNLKSSQLAEYICLSLFAFIIPISWRMATYAMVLLFVVAILKGIFEDGFKPNRNQYKNIISYILIIAFWAIYAISFFYSDNSEEARICIGRKLPFLLFPIYFLCSNLSYLTKERVGTIIYCLIFGILTLFAINFVWAIYDLVFNDSEIERLITPYKFFKTDEIIFPYVHRAYFSMMACLGLVFCVSEAMKDKPLKSKVLDLILCMFLVFVPFFLRSRAGMLCIALVLFILWIWITFVRNEKKIGLISGIVIICFLTIGCLIFSESISRFTNTLNNIKEGKGDCRITIKNGITSLIAENYMFGVGVGDRIDEIVESYERYKDDVTSKMIHKNVDDIEYYLKKRQTLLDSIDSKFKNEYTEKVGSYIDSVAEVENLDYSPVKENIVEWQTIKHCIKYELNAHNQFYDTIIAVGLAGLVLLIVIFITPTYLWIRNKTFDIVLFVFLFVVAFNCLFESVFERQMGMMFFLFFYFLLSHYNCCQQTDEKILNLKP